MERALRVLWEIGRNGTHGLTLAECSAVLGYSKATTHRILKTLADLEFVAWDTQAGVFKLGVATLRLGMSYLDNLDIRAVALPLLRDLTIRTGETTHLGVLNGAEVVYIEKVESPQPVRMFSRVGHTMPAHSTGLGKAILAYLPPEELDQVMAAGLVRRTPNTIVERSELRADLARARARGYSTDNVENEEGIRCVGAPVFDHRGAVCGAVSVAAPASRLTPERFLELGPLVCATAREISRRLGCEETWAASK